MAFNPLTATDEEIEAFVSGGVPVDTQPPPTPTSGAAQPVQSVASPTSGFNPLTATDEEIDAFVSAGEIKALAENPEYDVLEATKAGEIDQAMAVSDARQKGWGESALGLLKAAAAAPSALGRAAAAGLTGGGAEEVEDTLRGNLFTGIATGLAKGAYGLYDNARTIQNEYTQRGSDRLGISPPMVPSVASPLALLAGIPGEDSAEADRAKQEIAAGTQLAGTELGRLVTQTIGKSEAGREGLENAFGTTGKVLSKVPLTDLAFGMITGERYSDEEGKRNRFVRKMMFDDVSQDIGEGRTQGFSVATPEELEERGAPVRPQTIQDISTVLDVTNVPAFNPMFGAKIAGLGLKAAGKSGQVISSATKLGPMAWKAVREIPGARRFAPLASAGGLATAAVTNPIPTIAGAAAAGAGYAGLKTIGKAGRVLEEAGRQLTDPSFVSGASRRAVDAAVSNADKSFLSRNISDAFSLARNKADFERILTSSIGQATAAGVDTALLASLYATTPEEFLTEVAAGNLLGGFSGALLGTADRGKIRRDYGNVLSEEGAKIDFGLGLDDAHRSTVESMTPEDQRQINKYRGIFSKMRTDDGQPIQIYALKGPDYVAAIEKYSPNALYERNSSGERVRFDPSLNTEGFTTPDGSMVFLNADAPGIRPDTRATVLGHEGMHAVENALFKQVSPGIMNKLFGELRAEVYDKDGNPTPDFQRFIKDRFGKDSRIRLRDAESEFLGESARAVLAGGRIDQFLLPESIQQKLTRGASRFFEEGFGMEPKKGTTFRGEEISLLADGMNSLWHDVGRLARETPQDTSAIFRIQQLEADLSTPLPDNATPEQTRERATKQREHDSLLKDIEDNLEYPEYVAPDRTVDDSAARRDAFVDSYVEQLDLPARQAESRRAEAQELFDSYVEAMEEAGLPLPDDDVLYSEVVRWGAGGELRPRPVPPSRQAGADATGDLSTVSPEPDAPLGEPVFNEEGWAIDPQNPDRIIRQRPEDRPVAEVTVEEAAIDAEPVRAEETVAQQGETLFDEYVANKILLSEPIPPDASPAAIAERNRLRNRQRRLVKIMRDEMGIDPSQLDFMEVSENATISIPDPETGVVSETSEVASDFSVLDTDNEASPESQGVDMSPIPVEVESTTETTSTMADIPAAEAPTAALPASDIPSNMRPVVIPAEEMTRIDGMINTEIRAEYKPGRKRPETVNREVGKLYRDKLAKIHKELAPTDTDSITWRVDEVTGREGISGKRFIRGDFLSDKLMEGLTDAQKESVFLIQDNADNGISTPLVYDSAKGAASSAQARREAQTASSASARAEGQAPSQPKNDIFYPLFFSVTADGSINSYGLSMEKFLGNSQKLARILGDESPYTGINDPVFVSDLGIYVQNQQNGWKGDGSGVVVSESVSVNPDYQGVVLDTDPSINRMKSDFINMAFGDESARGKSDRSAARRQTAAENSGFLSPEGESNALRDRLNREGKIKWDDVDDDGNVITREGSANVLSRAFSNLRADLIYQVNQLDPDAIPIHRDLSDQAPDLSGIGAPRSDVIAAGFRDVDLSGLEPQVEPRRIPMGRIAISPAQEEQVDFSSITR